MKYEWRKKEKSLYLPKKMEIVDIPSMNYITIEGEGLPGGEDFTRCVGALYAIAYSLKMNLKNKEGFYDYTVYPLEGVWDLTERGRELYSKGSAIVDIKEHMKYKVMIRQPEFVTEDIFEEYRELAYSKKKNEAVMEVKYEQIKDGLSCQMIHVGSYDDEPESFKNMEEFSVQKGYKRLEKTHREIYISDPSRVAPEKLKTTIRFKVKRD